METQFEKLEKVQKHIKKLENENDFFKMEIKRKQFSKGFFLKATDGYSEDAKKAFGAQTALRYSDLISKEIDKEIGELEGKIQYNESLIHNIKLQSIN